MNSRSIFFLVLAMLCVYALKNWPRNATNSKQDNEPVSAEVIQPIVPDLKIPSPSDTPKMIQIASSKNEMPSPKTSMNQKFFERYQKSDITERLQQARRLQQGDQLDSALTSLSVYSVKTQTHQLKIYSSFDSYLQGCISIGENNPIQGSTANSTVEVFKLPEEHAYAIYVQKIALVVIYADIEKWGQRREDEEPRLLLYYRKNPQGKWILLGKGDDSSSYDPNEYRNQMKFCDFPQHR